MEQSQLIELIKTIMPSEKKHLLEFTNLSYFNSGRMRAAVGPLLEICLNHPWHDSGQRLEKKDVYNAIFPGNAFVEGKLEKVMVEAQKVIRSFWLTQHYFREENEFYQVFDHTEILRLKNLESRYESSLGRLKRIQEESPWRNSAHFHKQFLMEGAIHYVESLKNQGKGDVNISNYLHSIEIHYHLRRIALLSRYLMQQHVGRLEMPDEIKLQLSEALVPERYMDESPPLRINFTILTILKKGLPELTDVRELFNLLLRHETRLDPETLQEFYTYLRNFSIMILAANREKIEICFTLHELYVDNLRRGYLHYEGKLSPSRYLGIAENALKIKQFDWCLEFIEAYKGNIHGADEGQNLYKFNYANYLFGVGRFAECLMHIPPTSPYIDYMLLGKRLELKAYYELQSDLFSYKLDSFKMFLSRTSQKILSETQRQTHADFANLLHQLNASVPNDLKRAEIMIKRVEEKNQTVEWRWLLEKAKALKERR